MPSTERHSCYILLWIMADTSVRIKYFNIELTFKAKIEPRSGIGWIMMIQWLFGQVLILYILILGYLYGSKCSITQSIVNWCKVSRLIRLKLSPTHIPGWWKHKNTHKFSQRISVELCLKSTFLKKIGSVSHKYMWYKNARNRCHQYYFCPGLKCGHPPVGSTGAFRLFISGGDSSCSWVYCSCTGLKGGIKELIL